MAIETNNGVEVRVHGIGDHATYSALGKPDYVEVIDSRMWIGSVPSLPPHKLRLINWSRASRKITRNVYWYLAFPFTLLNVAGYMTPRNNLARGVMRVAIAICGLMLTIGMASWLTVIIETAVLAFDSRDDRLTRVIIAGGGATVLIVSILYRMILGRPLVDRGNRFIALLNVAVLIGAVAFYQLRLANREGSSGNYWDPMTGIVLVTTGVVCVVALVLCVLGWLPKLEKRTAFAGAGILLMLAVSLLHAGGSIIRLFVATVLQYTPATLDHVRNENWHLIDRTLLPYPDDMKGDEPPPPTTWLSPRVSDAADKLQNTWIGTTNVGGGDLGEPLRLDLVPLFLVVLALVFAGFLALESARLFRGLERKTAWRRKTATSQLKKKPPSWSHVLIVNMDGFLGRASSLTIAVVLALWLAMIIGFLSLDPSQYGVILDVMKVAAVTALLLIIVRRPDRIAERLRATFGSIADIAGFWAPNLHPLAGASYRRALLSGIRLAVRDLRLDYPNERVALVGHSQGSVICAWFIRGGHWRERRTEGRSDDRAIKEGLHNIDREPSDYISLFTCGSPLESLYATFFPRYFDEKFFVTAAKMSSNGRWHNYWRVTDPIGTRLNPKNVIANHNVTEQVQDDTRGHGEYWREQQLRREVRTALQPTATATLEHQAVTAH